MSDARVITLLSMGTSGLITLLGLIAGVWTFFEWRNDYFFVTNLRVVWRERILFRSASRQEVPLRAIQSLDVQTPNVFARLIDIGDLVIRTFNSQMRLTDVIHPNRMKDMVDAFLQKARRKTVWAEQAAIRQTIRQRLGRSDDDQPEEAPAATLKVQETKHRLTHLQDPGGRRWHHHLPQALVGLSSGEPGCHPWHCSHLRCSALR